MAKTVKLKIEADSSNAVQGLNTVDNSIKNTVESLAVASAGLVALKKGFDGLADCVVLASKQEDIFNKLSNAIEITGTKWEETKPQLDRFFASIQETTKYGDTETAEVPQHLTILTGDYEKSLKNLPLVLDIAASGLFDVSTATRYVGMAMSGNVEALGRYIPELKASLNPQLAQMSAAEKTAYALDVLRQKFSGLASKELNTVSGQWAQFQNYWGDLKESIGDAFLPLINKHLPAATTAIKRILGLLRADMDAQEQYMESLAGKSVEEVIKLNEVQKKQIEIMEELKRETEEQIVAKQSELLTSDEMYIAVEAEIEALQKQLESQNKQILSKQDIIMWNNAYINSLYQEEEALIRVRNAANNIVIPEVDIPDIETPDLDDIETPDLDDIETPDLDGIDL
jgi:hypothetical protein